MIKYLFYEKYGSGENKGGNVKNKYLKKYIFLG